MPDNARIEFHRSRRARRYGIEVRNGDLIRVTVPLRGSLQEARRFLESHWEWARDTLRKEREHPLANRWQVGGEVWYRGRRERVLRSGDGVRIADLAVPVEDRDGNLQLPISRALARLALRELPDRVALKAREMGVSLRRVTIRDQRTVWGSCSRKGGISLNWRLIQMPLEVSGYIVCHELSHMVHFDHSPLFWRMVAAHSPGYRDHRKWLNEHGHLLLRR